MLRLNLGSGNIRFKGFTNVDLYDDTADIKANLNDLPFNDNSVAEIMCIQVIEHIHYAESAQVLSEMYRVLVPGGTALIETPDIEIVAKNILRDGLTDQWMFNLVGEYYRPQDKNRYEDWYHNAASIHRNPWSYGKLASWAKTIGFTIERLPWEDSNYKCEENLVCRLTKPA